MGNELFQSVDLDFGYGYEVLRFVEDKFEYINDLLYFAVLTDCDARDRYIRHRIVGSIIKYLVVDEFAVLLTQTASPDAVKVDLINPIGKFSQSRAMEILDGYRTLESFPFLSNDYCMVNIYRVDGTLFESVVQTMSRSNPRAAELILVSDGVFNVATQGWVHKEVLKEIRRDRASKGGPRRPK